jgi:hypothetical protein
MRLGTSNTLQAHHISFIVLQRLSRLLRMSQSRNHSNKMLCCTFRIASRHPALVRRITSASQSCSDSPGFSECPNLGITATKCSAEHVSAHSESHQDTQPTSGALQRLHSPTVTPRLSKHEPSTGSPCADPNRTSILEAFSVLASAILLAPLSSDPLLLSLLSPLR